MTVPDVFDVTSIEFPTDATDAQREKVERLARDFRAASMDVTAWVGLGAPTPDPCPLCATTLPTELVVEQAIECPAHQVELWLYVVVHPLHGGDFHAGVAPDGAAHS